MPLEAIRNSLSEDQDSKAANHSQRNAPNGRAPCSSSCRLGLAVDSAAIGFCIPNEKVVSDDRDSVPKGDDKDEADDEVNDLLGVVGITPDSDDMVDV